MARIDNPWARARSDLPWTPPDSDVDGSRSIPFKVWDLTVVRQISDEFKATGNERLVQYVTADCGKNIAALEWEIQDVVNHLLLLSPTDYHRSEWCERKVHEGTRVRPDARWIPCDAYTLKTTYENPRTGWRGIVEYFFKFGLSPTGTLVFMVSVHPST